MLISLRLIITTRWPLCQSADCGAGVITRADNGSFVVECPLGKYSGIVASAADAPFDEILQPAPGGDSKDMPRSCGRQRPGRLTIMVMVWD